ncbi:HesA/MoeB/ThiF family protein [Alteromonadaceae bacterium BrNp21-10]|nr:HesA/MoeB/ThiF family protein [Alteromonadaceae bacterium BrNp21-10]
MNGLSNHAFLRYNRHIMLDKVGELGQQKLQQAHIMLVGMGGLGCPAAQYLVASGVGQLTLVDHDVIELSNLQRQILYTDKDIGQSKVTVAQRRLSALNPLINIDTIQDSIFNLNGSELQSVDIILDCTDNADTRRLINQLCYQNQIKLVSAAAIKEQGQLVSFDFTRTDSPCYQCLFADNTPQAINCANSGVLSPLLGVMGSLQASLAMQLLLGNTDNLNRLIMVDVWGMQVKQLTLSKDPYCRCCNQ